MLSENRVQLLPAFQLWCWKVSEEQPVNTFYLNVPNEAGKHFRSVTTDWKDMYIHVSMPFSQIIPPSPSPTESKSLYYTSVSLLLSCIEGYHYHFFFTMVTVDINILFFICLVSLRPTWCLLTTHRVLTCQPTHTEWNKPQTPLILQTHFSK